MALCDRCGKKEGKGVRLILDEPKAVLCLACLDAWIAEQDRRMEIAHRPPG
jgi:hypothetical protein